MPGISVDSALEHALAEVQRLGALVKKLETEVERFQGEVAEKDATITSGSKIPETNCEFFVKIHRKRRRVCL